MRSAVHLSSAYLHTRTSTKTLTTFVICCCIHAVAHAEQLATASNDCCRKNGVSSECLGLCHSAATHDVSHIFVGGMLCRYKFEHITKACNRGEAVVGNRTDQAFFAELAAHAKTGQMQQQQQQHQRMNNTALRTKMTGQKLRAVTSSSKTIISHQLTVFVTGSLTVGCLLLRVTVGLWA